MNIQDETKNLIKLILRSPDKGEGWRHVSDTLIYSVASWVKESPELFETKQDNGLHVRLSDTGKVIAAYL